MKILVIAEHDNSKLAEATLNAVSAATQFGGEVLLLVAGSDCGAVVAQASSLQGVTKVLVADAAHYRDQLVENIAALALRPVQEERLEGIVTGASNFGKSIAPRGAALLDVAPVSDVISIAAPGKYTRPIYAGNVVVSVLSDEPIQVLTVRTTAFAPAQPGGNATSRDVTPGPDLGLSRLVARELTKSARPELAVARIVVAGGRGLGSGEKFHEMLDPLADQLGAALGASRAAVDAGFVSNDYQVGQTGKIVAPELYIAVGISGAIQHVAGMKDSKVIVAINKDPDALIFQVADYGLVGDLFEVVPALVSALAAA